MLQQTQNWIARFGFSFALSLIACSAAHAQEVRTNYLPGTDFSKYRTYQWVTIEDGPHPDQILDEEIRRAIDSQLVAKGFTKVDNGKVDLLVSYRAVLDRERQWNAYGWRDGGPWGMLGGGMASGTATSSTINVGTLVLDIYDPSDNQLVWSGYATQTLNPSKRQEKNQKKLDKAMEKLLKDFPPKANR
jgi:hypothetical protein